VGFHRVISLKKGITLIELLIALAVTSILVSVVVLALKASLDIYHFVQEDLILQKVLDEVLQETADGDFESYGIRDSLEILSASSDSIVFVPLWIDDTHRAKGLKPQPEKFILNRPFKAGAGLPIGEVEFEINPRPVWKPLPLELLLGEHKNPSKPDDLVISKDPLPAGAKVRFIFHPDATNFPDCTMTIKLDKDEMTRRYKNETEILPRHNIRGVTLKNIRFQYFDNTNTEILPLDTGSISKEHIPGITAVKLSLTAAKDKKTKQGSVFVNIRNTRTSGSGLIIRKGTRLKIPDSHRIRTFSLGNIVGIKEGDFIKLEARSQKGRIWKINIELGIKDNLKIIRKYYIDYPAGQTVYSEAINLTTDLPLNFLTLGGVGRYDYDFDEDIGNIVDLEGDVELTVLQMDAAGAALFIRP